MLYDQDFYTWALQQAQLLREKKFQQVDWDHIIEEIEDLGRIKLLRSKDTEISEESINELSE
ncbi:hypothetical protein NIES932_29630 [Raphidiopsis curvata NIES-932]|nr:hypothetical protein NIES932_29630 [Raphidiopsis curvata NIES-932]